MGRVDGPLGDDLRWNRRWRPRPRWWWNRRPVVMLIVAPIAAMLLQLGISRQREYQADASGAQMVGQPYGLISALEKLAAPITS